MKAQALTRLRKVEGLEVPDPPAPCGREVLLKMERVGVCGSDIHYFEDGCIGPRAVQFPFILGHECAATVLRTGPEAGRIRAGDRVAVDPAISCHQCDQCRTGRENTCRRLRFLGCPGEAPGCLSEFLVMPEECLYPIPPAMTLDQAVLCEPLSIALYAVRQAGLGPAPAMGMAVGILGAGPIGLSVLLCARHLGARRLFVTDLLEHRTRLAAQAGAAWVGIPGREDVAPDILAREPAGLDIVFECAGQPEAMEQAIDLLKPGGRLMLIGIPRSDRISLPIDLLRRKEITLVNVRRQNRCVPEVVDLLAAGKIQADFLVTHHFGCGQAQAAFELVSGYANGVVKAMITFP